MPTKTTKGTTLPNIACIIFVLNIFHVGLRLLVRRIASAGTTHLVGVSPWICRHDSDCNKEHNLLKLGNPYILSIYIINIVYEKPPNLNTYISTMSTVR